MDACAQAEDNGENTASIDMHTLKPGLKHTITTQTAIMNCTEALTQCGHGRALIKACMHACACMRLRACVCVCAHTHTADMGNRGSPTLD